MQLFLIVEVDMNQQSISRNNHYVPQVYLKQWSSAHERVWIYRLLVADARVPLWTEKSLRGIAYHEHLYTRIAATGETDELESWLNREFESPAKEANQQAITNRPLSPADWKCLVRFAAAQYVRTPARFSENYGRWSETLPELFQSTLQDAVQELENAHKSGKQIEARNNTVQESIPFPLRVTTELEPGAEMGMLKAETIVGRSLWLFYIRHILTETINRFQQQRWTILSPPPGLTWFTSDDPVICLNYYGNDQYDFKGGWGNPGTEILMPLGPQHLLYTKVGAKRPRRGTVLPRETAEMIRRFIAEHAHRMIFAVEQDPEVAQLRPRVEDVTALRNEQEQWRRWHQEQSRAERSLLGLNKE
jgi:hypothetical protein